MRNGRLARRRHQQQEGAPLPDQPGRVQVLPAQAVAVAAWAEVVEPAAPVDAIDRAQPRALPSQLRADQVATRQWLQFDLQAVTSGPEAHRQQHRLRRCWIPLAVH
jgi:hypothetical protein